MGIVYADVRLANDARKSMGSDTIDLHRRVLLNDFA
jgi:hypothetical protein